MAPLTQRPLPGTVRDPFYIESDGKPLGETDFHVNAIFDLRETLRDHFANQPNVYVASNMFLHYEQGNPAGHRDPDVLFARGVVGNHSRRSFRVWEEGCMPRVLFEITSEGTWREDLFEKRELYARLGVAEYFLFDPEALVLDPVLQGFRLVRGQSKPLVPATDGSLTSVELGLRLAVEGHVIRLYDLQTDQPILTRREQADEARRVAEEAEQRAAEEKRRATTEKRRANKAQRLAEEAAQQAQEEKRRADELAAEVARLRALLGGQSPPAE